MTTVSQVATCAHAELRQGAGAHASRKARTEARWGRHCTRSPQQPPSGRDRWPDVREWGEFGWAGVHADRMLCEVEDDARAQRCALIHVEEVVGPDSGADLAVGLVPHASLRLDLYAGRSFEG